jgi:hypothetical protein
MHMETRWGKLFRKKANQLVAKSLQFDGIELVTNEQALSLRGGDKDYSPTYEYQVEESDKFTGPSILLKT